MATFSFDTPGRSVKRFAEITGGIPQRDVVDRAIAENGIVFNDRPVWHLTQPTRIGWCAWEWSVLLDERPVAEGRNWSKARAYKRRERAYKAALAELEARLADEDGGCE